MAGHFLLAFVLTTVAIGLCVGTEMVPSILGETRPPCNTTLTTFRELQEAVTLNRTLTWQKYADSDSTYVVCVNLQPSTVEYVGYSSVAIESVSLIITGSRSAGNSSQGPGVPALVTCETQPASNDSDPIGYPLSVSNSSLVVIEGVEFEGCIRPLQLNQITRVEFIACKFRNFNPGGAVDIFKCLQVVIHSSTFANNVNFGLGDRPYSGNAGAIAIGYDETTTPTYHPHINIVDSIFENNSANGTSDFETEASLLLKQRIFTQRGGGLAFYIGTVNNSAQVKILRCSFSGNFARGAGGGLYINLLGANSSHSISIQECNFTNNSAKIGAGLDTFYHPVTYTSPNSTNGLLAHRVAIINCVFAGNTAQYGGALSNIQLGYLNALYVSNCSFVDNEGPLGAALYLHFLFTTFSFVPERRIVIKDCMIVNNSAMHGVLFATRNTVRIQGDTLFKDNTGPAIQALSSLIRFSGNIVFERNRDHPNGLSGVIYLSTFGQIMLEENVDIFFKNNTGREGASIVVFGQSLSETLGEQLYNPQCFLQYQIPTAPPPTWKVNLTFEDNEAVVGPVVYISGINACIWNSTNSPFFSYDLQDIGKVWRFMTMNDNFILRGSEAVYEPDYYIQTTVEYLNISLPENQIIRSPGESIVVEIDALDELMHNTSAFLQIRVPDSSVTFVPSVVKTIAGKGEVDFVYLSDKLSGNTTVQIIPSFTSSDTDSLEDGTTLTLVHEPCLPGYIQMNKECVCEENDKIVECIRQDQGLLLAVGLWGNFSSEDRKLVTHVCPPGYCNCSHLGFFNGSDDVGCFLNYNDVSAICDETRTDMLCGRCRGDHGVGLLTNHCRQFKSSLPQFWVFLIYLLVLVPLLVVIVKLGVHLPTILRGLILYTQISPIALEFLPQTFDLKVDVMSFIGSTLGFYLPYDFSFHRGMTSLESYGLRYMPHIVALIVVPFTVRFRHHHFKYWHGVWTIIQLMFIMPVHTSVSLLLCPYLIGSRVWFYDGTVQCYHGWHILLAVVALISLLALIFLVLVVAAALKFNLLRRKVHHSFGKLEPFCIALSRGLKREYWWWPLVDLICKYTLILTIVYLVGQKVLALLNCLVFLFLQFYVHPYKSSVANYLESFVLFILVVLLALGSTPVVTEILNVTLWPLLYLPIFVGAVVVLAFVGYRIWEKFFQKRISKKSWKRKDTNRKSKRVEREKQLQATQSEVFISELNEERENDMDADFTLWEESTNM